MKKIKARKVKMTQVWREDVAKPVTVLRCDSANQPLLEGLKEGDRVDVSGLSKGKGFQGVVKRHGFHGGPKSHGQKDRLRAPGSIGATAPQRVIKGRRMAGHMGQERVTVRHLSVVSVEPSTGTLMLLGAVPGSPGTMVEVRA